MRRQCKGAQVVKSIHCDGRILNGSCSLAMTFHQQAPFQCLCGRQICKNGMILECPGLNQIDHVKSRGSMCLVRFPGLG